jgi:hypothetical protein
VCEYYYKTNIEKGVFMKSLMVLFILGACASGPEKLSDKAKNLEVYGNKPADCQVVGKFVGNNEIGSKELALNSVLNQAAKVGATGVHVNQEVPNGSHVSVYATAYQCN